MRKLSNWIDSYMQYTDNSEPPILYRKWCAISAIAAAMRRKCWLPWAADMTLYPNMYVILVGPPAARKGTAMSPAERLLRDAGLSFVANSITKEALIRVLKGAETVTNLTDGTIARHSSLTVFSKELVVFVGQSNYGLLGNLTDWFDCPDDWSYMTKNQGSDFVKGVWINLIGATTPELIRSSLPIEALGGGFNSRCIFVYEEKKGKVVPLPTERPEERELRIDLLEDLYHITEMSGNFAVSMEFLNMWERYYIASQTEEIFPPNALQYFGGYIERRGVHALKLSMIMNAARTDDMFLVEDDLAAALNLLKQTEKKMPRTFAGMGKGSDAETYIKMLRFIAENARSVGVCELATAFRSDGTMAELVATAKSLVDTGVAVWTDKNRSAIKWSGKNE